MTKWILIVLAAAWLVPPARAADGAGYRIADRYRPGGEGGWDYLTVDPAAHRLYVARSTRVQVLELPGGRVVGEIPDTPRVHGVALAPGLGRGFTSNGRDSSVTVFHLKTLARIARIRLPGRNPDAILYEPVTKRVFTFNGRSRDATAIDAAGDRVVGSVPLGGRSEAGVADGSGRVYVNLEDSSSVVVFDPGTLAVAGRWPLAPGEAPTGLALDREHHRLFSVCHNQRMVVLDAVDGRIVATLPIGAGVDGATYDPATGLALSSNGEGSVTVVHEDGPDRFTVRGQVATQRGARTLALDPASHSVYLATASFGEAPAPTAENPRPRPPMVAGSFVILVLDR